MESERILLFQPVRTSWHFFCAARSKPIVHIKPTDSLFKKMGARAANFSKNRVVEIAMVISTLFSGIYSLITYPIRAYFQAQKTEFAIDNDLSRLTPREQVEMEKVINKYFSKHYDHFEGMSKGDKSKLSRIIISQVARSQRVYGPIVRNWVDRLLEKAEKENKKLVFMARDGIPFYHVALELMKEAEYRKKYPKLAESGAIVLGYFSRNLVASASGSGEGKEIFGRYVSEELKIQKGDQCIFCDIGFSGSMVEPIRKLMPEVKIEFNFLVATSDKAEGYLGNPSNPLPNLETAANNLGVRWVEESHHGNIASATKLVVDDQGRVRPDTLYPKKVRFDQKFSQPYLIRKFSLKKLIEYAVHLSPLSKEEAAKARDTFSQAIGAIKANQAPLFVGWDY